MTSGLQMKTPLQEDTANWPPEQTVFPVGHIDLRVLEGDHPFHLHEASAARANWLTEITANPALFEGRMVFQHRMAVSEDGIFGDAYVVPFSTFLWWRKQTVRAGGFHVFAFPVLVTSDNALVAIRMGQHTANPGQVYFAAGSLDENDIVDGRCDIEGNMRREVLEETGLDLSDVLAEPGYHASHFRHSLTVFRLFRFPVTADELVARIEAHMPHAADQEIEGAVAIRSADPEAQPYNVSMLPILAWFFDRPR
ncbi:DNA mismatch repair protein MutT [Rhizobium tubonense]|uniref:DNA mismatch repair protein MutT n=2 Tax=Rhizobium tubonense TaxID=484088 RepID=A0A2W4ETA9_9HYPH|nr:DNA mismatch repair protein MutT [Rhizobium tubonense]